MKDNILSEVIELNGELQLGNEWDELYIGDDSLTNAAEEVDGNIVKLKYYLSNKPINKETVVEDFLRTFYEGIVDANGMYCHGSSWTGVYAKNDELSVGGHDIISELSVHLGEYCYLIIETKN